MQFKELPNQKTLHDALEYNPNTGVFIWKHRSEQPNWWNGKFAGTKAGSKQEQGISIYVNNIKYQAHRLAWVYVYGVVPVDNIVDHINCDWHDNRIENLRLSTHGQNGSNSRGWTKKYLSKGVSTQTISGRYRARIGVDKKVLYLGTFNTEKEAHKAYIEAAVKYKGEFARGA